MCPVITDCFLWFFLLSSCHRTCIDSSRWELTQLFSWMAAIFLFCFILTLLSLFIHFILCQDKKVIYSYLWTQILPLVSCYSFPIIHSDCFTALLVVLLRHLIAPGTKSKSKLLTVACEFSKYLGQACPSVASHAILILCSFCLTDLSLLSLLWQTKLLVVLTLPVLHTAGSFYPFILSDLPNQSLFQLQVFPLA